MALVHKYNEEWGDDQRMNIIGQNGNDGLHYSRRECDRCTNPDECTRCIHNREVEQDTVNHPTHYTQGDIECIDAIRASLTDDEWRGYIKGNILKYTWREKTKGGDESLEKARWYLNRLLDKTR